MLQKIIHRLLLRRHFWRYATFSEVAELYASRLMRRLAINISAAFISVFMYQNGYSVTFIAGYWVAYYGLKTAISIPCTKYAARFGAKHGMLLSNLLYIPSMVVFAFVPSYGVVAIIAAGVFQAVSATMYDLCYLIDFSKVKSVEHAGKEIAYMNIFDKIATGLSPLIGGMIAFLAGPQATMFAAAALFAFAAIPLLKTNEVVQTNHQLTFKDFPWRMAWRSLVAEAAIGFDIISSGIAWSLLVAIAILGVRGNQVYAELGALLSLVLLAALAASYLYGLLIDKHRGKELLVIMGLINAGVHVTRPFITTPQGVAAVNVGNEMATTGYAMAFMRGMFDTADISGNRLAYFGAIEVVVNAGSTLGGLVFLWFVMMLGDTTGMRSFYYVAAVVALLIMMPKFRLYRR